MESEILSLAKFIKLGFCILYIFKENNFWKSSGKLFSSNYIYVHVQCLFSYLLVSCLKDLYKLLLTLMGTYLFSLDAVQYSKYEDIYNFFYIYI